MLAVGDGALGFWGALGAPTSGLVAGLASVPTSFLSSVSFVFAVLLAAIFLMISLVVVLERWPLPQQVAGAIGAAASVSSVLILVLPYFRQG